MGALHRGHLSLVDRSVRDNDLTIVSIFVNPTQFGPKEDYLKYPRPLANDLKMLRRAGVDVVFVPKSSKEIYPLKDEFKVRVPNHWMRFMEAKFRPGHFEGVATVVLKYFLLVQPRRAYFGRKDFQQLRLIESLVESFGLNIKIIGCPTLREKTGLALSSRNIYLSDMERIKAAEIFKSLKESKTLGEASRRLRKQGFKIDYLESWNDTLSSPDPKKPARWLVAGKLGGVRLIDNVLKKS